MSKDFVTNMRAAYAFRALSQEPDEQEFWAGYVRGLRRHHHGEKFGTADEHALWIAAVDSSDQSRKMRGLGYRAGLEGQNIQQAMKSLVERKYMSDLGKKTSPAKKKAARENGKKGGWPKGRPRKKKEGG